MKKHTVFSFVLLFAILSGHPLWGQSFTSLTGTITDPSSAMIPGATIELVNAGTHAARSTTSDQGGLYNFPELTPGTYNLTVKAAGFAEKQITDLQLLVASPATVNVQLNVAGTSQKVEVSATATVVNTTDASLGTAIGGIAITQLPLLARNPAALLQFQPGVVTTSTTASSLPYDDQRNGSVNGGHSDQSNITLDGMDVNDQVNRYALTTTLRVTPDSIGEFRTTTLNPTVEEGRSSGAQIALVTKSGTDAFHGSLYEYNRNTALAANNYFNNQYNIPEPALNINVFGGSVGGPIVRNKLFFFVNYEGRRDASGTAVTQTIPSMGMRNGYYNYLSTDGTVHTLTPTDIAALDPAHIGADPAILSYMQQYPTPNDPALGDGYNLTGFRFTTPQDTRQNTETARFDYVMSSRNSLFWRGTLQNDHASGAPGFPGQAPVGTSINNNKGFVVGWTSVLKPSLVNSVHFGFTNVGNVTTAADSGVGYNFMDFISNYNPVGTGDSWRYVPVYEVSDDLAWIHGRHNFHAGFETIWVRNRTLGGHTYTFGDMDPQVLQDGGFSLLPADLSPSAETTYLYPMDDLMGLAGWGDAYYQYDLSGNILPSTKIISRDWASTNYEFYFGDTWKINRAYTLTAGLRYSLAPPVFEVNGYQSSTIPLGADWFNQRTLLAEEGLPDNQVANVSYVKATGPGGSPLYPYHKRDFAPRVALAYSPQADSGLMRTLTGGPGKTVIRGGMGLFYDIVGQPLAAEAAGNNVGFSSTIQNPSGIFTEATVPRIKNFNIVPSQIIVPAPPGGFPQVEPRNFSVGYQVSLDGKLQPSYAENYNLTIEREFGSGFSVQVSYVGTVARHTLVNQDLGASANLVDNASGTTYFQAATQLAELALAKTPASQVQPVKFFEDLWPGAAGAGGTATQAIYQLYQQHGHDYTGALFEYDADCIPSCSKFGPGAIFNPNFPTYAALKSNGWGNYNAMQLSVQKRMTQGLQFRFNWTYGKALDVNSDAEREGPENYDYLNQNTSFIINPWNLRQNYGLADYNARFIWNAFAIWQLPFGKGKMFAPNANKILDAIIGGWQITPTWFQTTGFPIGVRQQGIGTLSLDRDTWASQTSPLPARHINKNGPYGPNNFANPVAALGSFSFSLPGSAGSRNPIVGQGNFDIDLGVGKRFVMPYNENHSLQFRWEFYNLTNTVRFDPQGMEASVIHPSLFGTYTNTLNSPRQMQIVMRYEF